MKRLVVSVAVIRSRTRRHTHSHRDSHRSTHPHPYPNLHLYVHTSTYITPKNKSTHVESLSADNDLDELDMSALGQITILNGFELMCRQAEITVAQVQNCARAHEFLYVHMSSHVHMHVKYIFF